MIDILWNQFWDIDILNGKEKKTAYKIYKFTALMSKSYQILITLCVITYFGASTLRGNKNLIMNIWFPVKNIIDTSPYYEITFLIEAVVLGVSVIFALAQFDMLFMIMIGFVQIQFHILNCQLKHASPRRQSKTHKTITECIVHHNLLFE